MGRLINFLSLDLEPLRVPILYKLSPNSGMLYRKVYGLWISAPVVGIEPGTKREWSASHADSSCEIGETFANRVAEIPSTYVFDTTTLPRLIRGYGPNLRLGRLERVLISAH